MHYAVVGYIDAHVPEISADERHASLLPHLRRIESEGSHIANANRDERNACLIQRMLQLQLFARYLHIAALLSGVRKCQIGRREKLDLCVSDVRDQLLLVRYAVVANERAVAD